MLIALVVSVLGATACAHDTTADSPPWPTRYHFSSINGLSIFYREAGSPSAPTILLLHGFPSSSRMYQPLLDRLSARYHLIAPDYPGFGASGAPAATAYPYTFEHITDVVDTFTKAMRLKRYVLFMQDYGGPVGIRLAIRHPDQVRGFVIQNAVFHRAGLGPLWRKREEFWADRAAKEAELRATFFSPDTTRQRHVGSNPQPDTIDPDRWSDEQDFLSRPGETEIQSDLFYDYRTNVASYPAWDAWLRKHQPPSLVVWGRYDPSFQVDEVAAYRGDVPQAQTHVLDAGHFALYDRPEEVADLVGSFVTGLAN
ncbi:alpha/beta fold hydrolase [Mycobacterium simiae]|uniref:Alpha/beta hydrolase n=1 Tax=Mycobacterium simiae TaxID=1784 RepID=A0A1X0XY28_MYCSI|nr:alpha/beta hydrolase [Mycobacterium simiae]ORJ57831.1 alpha/beta hydrolase [Mycobacterium simiae]